VPKVNQKAPDFETDLGGAIEDGEEGDDDSPESGESDRARG